MKILKFGGTSVGSAQRMKDVAKLICTGDRNIVVLSAMSGTTNSLVEISDYLYKKNPDGANEIINKLAQKYYGHIEELYSTDEYKQKAKELVKSHFDYIRTFTKDLFTLFEEKVTGNAKQKADTLEAARMLQKKGYKLYATGGSSHFLTENGVENTRVYWPSEEGKPQALDMLHRKEIDMVVNIPKNLTAGELDNGYKIRRAAIDLNVPLITNARLASAFINAFCTMTINDIAIKSWAEYK